MSHIARITDQDKARPVVGVLIRPCSFNPSRLFDHTAPQCRRQILDQPPGQAAALPGVEEPEAQFRDERCRWRVWLLDQASGIPASGEETIPAPVSVGKVTLIPVSGTAAGRYLKNGHFPGRIT